MSASSTHAIQACKQPGSFQGTSSKDSREGVAPAAVANRQLVIGHRVAPGVAATHQAVLLPQHKHQVLSQYLFRRRRKGGTAGL